VRSATDSNAAGVEDFRAAPTSGESRRDPVRFVEQRPDRPVSLRRHSLAPHPYVT